MAHLNVQYRFQDLPFIVADGKGVFYQLPHFKNNYSRSFRKLTLILNNGITEGYRIDRRFISLKQLRRKAYPVQETIEISIGEIVDLPF